MYKPDEMGRLTQPILTLLLQLGIFRFGFFQDGDVGVAVFPEREEIFVGGESAREREVAISWRASLALDGRVARPHMAACPHTTVSGLQRVGASYAQMRRGSGPAAPDDAAVVEIV